MKYILIVGDGMGDYPIPEYENKTPLEIAKIPYLDFLASHGEMGLVKTIPSRMPKGSDVANLSILGYNPKKYYIGRGFLEATNMGIKIDDKQSVFRCNLITVKNDILFDYSAGHISNKESHKLIKTLNEYLSTNKVKFFSGVSYRHILTLFEDYSNLICRPPHDIINQPFKKFLPKGKNSDFIINLINESKKILENHPVNILRKKENLNLANMIWPWGQGKNKNAPTFKEKYGLNGSVVSAVDLIKGIGKWIGLDVITVSGATGYLDTNYAGKVKSALKSLEKKDFVFIHIEAPDEASHSGELELKLKAIEDFDKKVILPMLEGLKKFQEYKIMVLPDHYTPLCLRTHSDDPVPWVIYSSKKEKNTKLVFNEKLAKKSGIYFKQGYKLIKYFLEK
ncbi:MAG: cofactor-independent phosphoglycerate mutase [bacterium]